MRAIVRFLRSRNLAVWLITGMTLYAFLMTLVPQGGLDKLEVVEWRRAHPGWAAVAGSLGLHGAWTQPVFLAAVLLLTASTAACAWDRTRRALRLWRSWGSSSNEYVARLRAGDAIQVSSDLDSEVALGRCRETLERAGLHPRSARQTLWATQRVWGAFGSPVFHWALVGLFLFAALGQAMRWEGKIGVVDGYRKPDVAAAYGYLSEGPLARRLDSTREFEVTSVQTDLVVGRADIGEAARVTLYESGVPVARRLVYPNHLLRHGNLLVHVEETGVGAVLVVRDPAGREVARDQVLFDFDQLEKGGRIRSDATLTDRNGEQIPAVIALPLDPVGEGAYMGTLPEEPRLEFAFPSLAPDATLTAEPGDSVDVPGGLGSILVEDIDRYARLFVVDDWSIPWLYTMLALACLGAAVALLAPPRAVLVCVESAADGDGCVIRITPRHRRIEPAFPDAVRAAISEAVEARQHGTADGERGDA